MILKKLGLKNETFLFDWNQHLHGYFATNILYNISLIEKLNETNSREIAIEYIGDAFKDKDKTNSITNITFPHDQANNEAEINNIIDKYDRRFRRLHDILKNKNTYILLTRNYYINEEDFIKIINVLQKMMILLFL